MKGISHRIWICWPTKSTAVCVRHQQWMLLQIKGLIGDKDLEVLHAITDNCPSSILHYLVRQSLILSVKCILQCFQLTCVTTRFKQDCIGDWPVHKEICFLITELVTLYYVQDATIHSANRYMPAKSKCRLPRKTKLEHFFILTGNWLQVDCYSFSYFTFVTLVCDIVRYCIF